MATLLTPSEAAKRVGVSPVTIHTWVRVGKLPAATETGPKGGVRLYESDIARLGWHGELNARRCEAQRERRKREQVTV
jgi:excisionase family DNA binding protein